MGKIGSFFKRHWGSFVFSAVFILAIIIIVNSVNGTWNSARFYSDGLVISGLSLIFIGGLSEVHKLGGFDIFSFYFNRKKIDGRKEDLYEYSTRKKEERSKTTLVFLPYVIMGALCLSVGIPLYYIGLSIAQM